MKELTEKLIPVKIEAKYHKPSETESKLLEIAGLRLDVTEKERRDVTAASARTVREDAQKESRGERSLEGIETLQGLGYDGRVYGSTQGKTDVATSFLAGAGAEALRAGHGRSKSWSCSKEQYQYPPQHQPPTYIEVPGRRGKVDSLQEVSKRLSKIEHSFHCLKTRIANPDWEGEWVA